MCPKWKSHSSTASQQTGEVVEEVEGASENVWLVLVPGKPAMLMGLNHHLLRPVSDNFTPKCTPKRTNVHVPQRRAEEWSRQQSGNKQEPRNCGWGGMESPFNMPRYTMQEWARPRGGSAACHVDKSQNNKVTHAWFHSAKLMNWLSWQQLEPGPPGGEQHHQQCRGAVLSVVNTAQVTQVSNLLGCISTVLTSKALTSYCLDLEE